MSAFVERFEYPGTVDEFRDRVLYEVIAKNLAKGDWALAQREHDQATFERYERAGWVYVVCVLLFPVGLLALLGGKTRNFVTFRWTAQGEHAGVVATGQAPRALIKQVRAIDGERLRQQLAGA